MAQLKDKLRFIYILISIVGFQACHSDSIKEKLNKAGDMAGQTAGELLEGVKRGVQKAFDIQVVLPEKLKDKGITFGKATVSSDSTGYDNLLILYLVFNKPFQDTLMARAFDENKLEMGRSRVYVSGKQKEARFIEFHFDKRTHLGSKDQITIE